MKDPETRRLIYARKVMDAEFDKCINSAVSKWDMVAELFNKGIVAKKRMAPPPRGGGGGGGGDARGAAAARRRRRRRRR